MAAEDKPLSTLVSQGWEVVSYAAVYDRNRAVMSDNFLLRRMKSHKILKVRRGFWGAGRLIVTELDI
jgi:hypothetical protein